MESKQLELIFNSLLPASSTDTTLADIPYGRSVSIKATGRIIAKVRPRGFILNSNLVGDVLNRGDCFVVDMETGDLRVLSRNTTVTY